MIKVQNLYKRYYVQGIETQALEKISFEVREGEFIAIMGPSGCGKSTLLNILGLVDSCSMGKYYFYNRDVTNLPENKRAKIRKSSIGFVFQNFNLIDELTVYENVELPLIYQNISYTRRKKLVNNILTNMNIAHRQNHLPVQLSGGQQQRVAVARAVVTNPKLILADEPTGNLDSVNGEEVINLLSDLNSQGTTIIMVTHDSHYANYADRIIHLFDGLLLAQTDGGMKID